MFTLAWVFLADLPELRTGLIIVGLARCIAMVLIWNDLACGNSELGAVLVAINSVFQILMYSVLGWFYLTVLPGWLGLDTQALDVGLWEIARSVLIFLGIPLLAGFLKRMLGEQRKGTEWYEQRFLPRIGPIALYGLLFTIVILFALQGEQITDRPFDVARVAVPLLIYFAVMWFASFFSGYRLGLPYDRNASVAFTAAGQQFRAGHSGGNLGLRGHQRPSPRRHDRPADRGSRPRRLGVRRSLGEAPLLPGPAVRPGNRRRLAAAHLYGSTPLRSSGSTSGFSIAPKPTGSWANT